MLCIGQTTDLSKSKFSWYKLATSNIIYKTIKSIQRTSTKCLVEGKRDKTIILSVN